MVSLKIARVLKEIDNKAGALVLDLELKGGKHRAKIKSKRRKKQ